MDARLTIFCLLIVFGMGIIFEHCIAKSEEYFPFMHFNPKKGRIKACSSFSKYSSTLVIGVGADNCSYSITKVIKALKTCRYSTDALKLVVYPEDSISDTSANYTQNFTTWACSCLVSGDGSLFINRGVTYSINPELNMQDVSDFCNIPKDWTSFSELLKNRTGYNNSLISNDLYLGNRFSVKAWETLKNMDNILEKISLLSPGVTTTVSRTVSFDIQEFVASAVCIMLHKSCERNRAANIQLQRPSLPPKSGNGKWNGSIGLLQKRDIQIAVNEMPIHNAPWEVEFSPALSYDHIRFAVSKRWRVNDKVFVRSFTVDLWISLFGMMILLVVLLISIDWYSRKLIPSKTFSEPLSIVQISCMLLIALLEQPQKIVKRSDVYIFMGCCGLILANLSTAYKSKLLENLIKLRPEKLPSTSKELLNSDYRINVNLRTGLSEAIIAIGEGKLSEFQNRSEGRSNSLSCLVYTLIGKYACVSLYNLNKMDATKLLSALNITDPIWNIFQYSQRDFGIYTTWAFRRGFPFKEKINDALGRILQSGLQRKWYNALLDFVKYHPSEKLHTITPIQMLGYHNLSKEENFRKLISYVENYKRHRSSLDSDSIMLHHMIYLFHGFCFAEFVIFIIFICEILVGNRPRSIKFKSKMSRFQSMCKEPIEFTLNCIFNILHCYHHNYRTPVLDVYKHDQVPPRGFTIIL